MALLRTNGENAPGAPDQKVPVLNGGARASAADIAKTSPSSDENGTNRVSSPCPITESSPFSVNLTIAYSPWQNQTDVKGVHKIRYVLNASHSYAKHIELMHRNLEIKAPTPDHFILEHAHKSRKAYVLAKELSANPDSFEGKSLLLRNQSADARASLIRLGAVCDWVSGAKSGGTATMKDILWLLDFEGRLKGEIFVETFVDGGGMHLLMTLLETSKRDNMTKVVVSCLYTACEYHDPIDYLRDTPGAMERLYRLVYKESIKLGSAVMEFLFLMASFQGGFDFIHKTVSAVDESLDRVPYRRIVEFLGPKKGIELNENALVFCNVMLQSAERQSDRDAFLVAMDTAGLSAGMAGCPTTTTVYLRNIDKFIALSMRLVPPLRAQIVASEAREKQLAAKVAAAEAARAGRMLEQIRVRILYRHFQAAKANVRRCQSAGLIPDMKIASAEIKELVELANDRYTVAKTRKLGLERKKTVAVDLYKKLEAEERAERKAVVKLKLDTTSIHNKIGMIRLHVARLTTELKDMTPARIAALETQRARKAARLDQVRRSTVTLVNDCDRLMSTYRESKVYYDGKVQERMRRLTTLQDKLKTDAKMSVLLTAHRRLQDLMKRIKMDPTKYGRSAEGAGLPKEVKEILNDPGIPKASPIPPPPSSDITGVVPPPPALGTIPPPPGLGGGVPPPPGLVPPPPCIGGGGVPAPPALGLALGGASSTKPIPVVTKPIIKPKEKMKNIFWTKIVLPMERLDAHPTVWRKTEHMDVNEDEVIALFGRPKRKTRSKKATTHRDGNTGKQTAAKKPRRKRKVLVKALDSKTSQKVGIALSQLPGIQGTHEAIVRLDPKLNEDRLAKLIQILPDEDSTKAIRRKQSENEKSGGDAPLRWDRPELLYIMLLKIKNLKPRLSVWLFSIQFEPQLQLVTSQLKHFCRACEEIVHSHELSTLIAGVLETGNYMNGGTKRGQADGFNVQFLAKVPAVKGNGGVTLLQFLARTMCRRSPTIAKISEKMPTLLQHSQRLPALREMRASAERLARMYRSAESSAKCVGESPLSDDDLFVSKMKPFFTKNSGGPSQLAKAQKRASLVYANALSWFAQGGSDAKKQMPSDEFLALFRKFICDFVTSIPKPEAKKRTVTATSAKRGGDTKRGRKIGVEGQVGLDAVIEAIRLGPTLKRKKIKQNRVAETQRTGSQRPDKPANGQVISLARIKNKAKRRKNKRNLQHQPQRLSVEDPGPPPMPPPDDSSPSPSPPPPRPRDSSDFAPPPPPDTRMSSVDGDYMPPPPPPPS